MTDGIMAEDTVAETTEVTASQPQPEAMSKGMSSLVDAISLILTEVATDSISANSKNDLPRILALLERTTSILKGFNQDTDDAAVTSIAENETATVQSESVQDKAETIHSESSQSQAFPQDGWKIAVSKTTGKVLGMFHDNKPDPMWYDGEDEEEVTSKNIMNSYNNAVRQCHEQVEIIIEDCRRANQKFRDPDFNLDDLDMCLLSLGNMDDFSDRRPSGNAQIRTIFENPQFYIDGAKANDIAQGRIGDDWFLAAISIVLNFEAVLSQNYVEVDGSEEVGVYGFVFYRDGEWIYEIVDDSLYLVYPSYGSLERLSGSGSLQRHMLASLSEEQYSATFLRGSKALHFAHSRDENETWLPLLEKAFAKAHGDYQSIEGGFVGEALEDLTGGVTTEIRIRDILDSDILWKEFLLCNEQFVFGCWTPSWADNNSESEGLVCGHAYSVMKAVEIDINGIEERLLFVRNPWGKSGWTGCYSDGSQEMDATLLKRLDYQTGDDGCFYMSFKDFLRKFEFIDRIRLISGDWNCAQSWVNLQVPRVGGFLGPKYMFTIDHGDQVIICLSQLDDRYFCGLDGQFYFALEFRVEKDGYLVAQSTRGINTIRSVNSEMHLEAGKYDVSLKITAEYWDNKMSVRDVLKHQFSVKHEKLVQVISKYNFAHLKRGIGDREDRVFEPLTACKVDEHEEKAYGSGPNTNGAAKGSELENGRSDPPPAESTGNSMISSSNHASDQVKSSTRLGEKESKSTVNREPVATVGLRIFTQKAKVTLRVV